MVLQVPPFPHCYTVKYKKSPELEKILNEFARSATTIDHISLCELSKIQKFLASNILSIFCDPGNLLTLYLSPLCQSSATLCQSSTALCQSFANLLPPLCQYPAATLPSFCRNYANLLSHSANLVRGPRDTVTYSRAHRHQRPLMTLPYWDTQGLGRN
jgi:hypothetical protein